MDDFVALALDWIPVFVACALLACLLLLPFAFFPRTRLFAAAGFVLASYVFGLGLWVTSAIFTFTDWGWFGLIAGVLILGVGVFPIAALTVAWHAAWAWLLWLLFLFALTMGARIAGLWLDDSASN